MGIHYNYYYLDKETTAISLFIWNNNWADICGMQLKSKIIFIKYLM